MSEELTYNQAFRLFHCEWWENVSDADVVAFQLFQEKLCVIVSVETEAAK